MKRSDQLRAVAFVLAVALLSTATGATQQPGPYQVGYTVKHEYDHSRTFQRPSDYAGNRIEGEIARPLQISVWYPAEPAPDIEPIAYEEYLWADLTRTDFTPPTGEDRRHYTDNLARVLAMEYRVERERFDSVSSQIARAFTRKARAFRDAAPAEGSFPLLIHMSGYNASPRHHAGLFESLAGHGFVVAALPSMGMYSESIDNERLSIQVQARDMDFAFDRMRGFPNVDPHRVGALGMSWGGMSNILFAQQNFNVDAVVTLDGAVTMVEELKLLESLPGYDVKAFRPAYLQLMVAPEEAAFRPKDLRFFEQLLYSDAWMVQFSGVTHDDFGCEYSDAIRSLAETDTAVATRREAFARLLREYILAFFDTYLEDDPTAEAGLQSMFDEANINTDLLARTARKTAHPAPPTQAELMEIVRTQNPQRALEIYLSARQVDSLVDLSLASRFMGSLYMEAFQAEEYDRALDICRAWQHANPADIGPLFSMGRAYRRMADSASAIDCYRRILESAGDERHRTSALEAIEELGGDN